MELIDTHSHIYYDKYTDINEVLDRARDNNISKIICVGVDIESSYKSITLAEKYDMIYATAGFHPHESKDAKKNYIKELENLLSHKKVVALGEIGLDFFYKHSDKETQINIFEEQLLLAKSMDIPCIIHNRESDKELINSINKTKNNNGVIHCFASNLDLATELIKLGFHLSFTGLITFAKELKHVIENIPIEKIMVETDSPYLTPIPHRGKRNEPYMVKYIAMEIAKIKNIPFKEVAAQTTKTAKKFFDI
ncbi:TatD family hydrolase [Candidatus Marinimicrobia bacterium]|nr:TatD family hydrolase [Candidatus Neomarinimicrobiota bacterium]